MKNDKQDEVVYDGRFNQMILRPFTSKTGKQLHWEMIKRKTFGRIVAIAAITPEREIILEYNRRVALKKYIYELPAGLMDKPGEKEIDCAVRELIEETGYTTDPLERIISGYFDSGVTDDEIIYFCGLNARYIKPPQREDAEDIEILKMPLDQLEDFLYGGAYTVDIKTSCVLPYLRKKGLLK